jgi:hypothetical protein
MTRPTGPKRRESILVVALVALADERRNRLLIEPGAGP